MQDGQHGGQFEKPISEMTPREALAGRPKVTDPNIQNALYVAELNWVSLRSPFPCRCASLTGFSVTVGDG